jgi:hypothetical protein
VAVLWTCFCRATKFKQAEVDGCETLCRNKAKQGGCELPDAERSIELVAKWARFIAVPALHLGDVRAPCPRRRGGMPASQMHGKGEKRKETGVLAR